MNTLWILMKRERWESPGMFQWLPLVISALAILVLGLSLAFIGRLDAGFTSTLDGLRLFAQMPMEDRSQWVQIFLFGVAAIFNVVLLFVVFFYLAGSLYDDRKDRSILFYKSLPVSDLATVGSKLLTACLLLPACFLAGIILTHTLLLLIASGYGLAAEVNPFQTFWSPSGLPGMWLLLLLGYLLQALWMLPIYGWVMLCSSWAPRFPVLIAIAVPVVIGLLQNYHSFLTSFRWSEFGLLQIIGRRLSDGAIPLQASIDTNAAQIHLVGIGRADGESVVNLGFILERLSSMEVWVGVAIGLLFLAGAVWGRRRASDI